MKRIATILAVVAASGAQAAVFNFAAHLDATQEVHLPNSPAYGSGSFQIDTVANRMWGSLTAINLVDGNGSVLDYHVHEAPFGVNGPIRVFLNQPGNIVFTSTSGSNTLWTASFDLDLTQAGVLTGVTVDGLVNLLLAGNGYFNVHTTFSPAGEIRGQLSETHVPEPASLAALGL
jgi:hypothetical protein